MTFYFNTHTKEIYTKGQYDRLELEYISENIDNMPIDQWAYDRMVQENSLFDTWSEEAREYMIGVYEDELREELKDKLSKAFKQDYCLLLSEKPIKVVKERG